MNSNSGKIVEMISCKLFSICGGLYTWPVHVACTRDGSSFHKLQVKEEHVDNRPDTIICDVISRVTPIIVFNALLTLSCSPFARVMNDEIAFTLWALGAACSERLLIQARSRDDVSTPFRLIHHLALLFARWFLFRIVFFPLNGLALFAMFGLLRNTGLPIDIRWLPVASIMPFAVYSVLSRLRFENQIGDLAAAEETRLIIPYIPRAKSTKQVNEIKQQLLCDLFKYPNDNIVDLPKDSRNKVMRATSKNSIQNMPNIDIQAEVSTESFCNLLHEVRPNTVSMFPLLNAERHLPEMPYLKLPSNAFSISGVSSVPANHLQHQQFPVDTNNAIPMPLSTSVKDSKPSIHIAPITEKHFSPSVLYPQPSGNANNHSFAAYDLTRLGSLHANNDSSQDKLSQASMQSLQGYCPSDYGFASVRPTSTNLTDVDMRQPVSRSVSPDLSLLSMQTIDGFCPSDAPVSKSNFKYQSLLLDSSKSSASSNVCDFDISEQHSEFIKELRKKERGIDEPSVPIAVEPMRTVSNLWDNVNPVVGQTSKLNLFEDESKTTKAIVALENKPSVMYQLPVELFNKKTVDFLKKRSI